MNNIDSLSSNEILAATKFKYIKDLNFARYPHLINEPDYRLVICHAIFSLYKNSRNIEVIKGELEKLKRSYDFLDREKTDCIYYLEGYLEIYKFKGVNGEYGYNLVDKSGGIYALMCYPYSCSSCQGESARERASGFRAAIDDITLHKKDKVILAFSKHKEWDGLQLELKSIFYGNECQ